MSASCQSIDSMFEVRPIGTRTKFKPVKKPTSEIPSVELVTELVEVELEELRFYVMVSVQYAPLGIADDNVYPWQDFPDTPFVVRNDGMMGGCHPVLFKGDIAAEPVRGHIGIPVRTLLNLARNGGRLEIVDDLHLYMPDTLGRTVLLGRRRLGQTAFRHDKDRGLALASPSALQRAIFLFFRRFRGKEALVNLHVPMEGVTSVALTHHVAQLMHHLPYGLVTLAANLTLYLLGGYGTLGRRQKEHGSKPVTDRQMAALHHRTGTKLHLMFAIHARPGLVARIPAQAQTAALTTEQAVMLTETTKGFLTGCLVGILTVKIKQVHNAYVYCFTFYILHKVFQNMVLGQLGSLNFANLVTCGHSFNHDHEGHDHEHEEHDHASENHEGHNHEAEMAAGHSDEIILAPEKAKAAGVESEIIQPKSFRQVITTSGQVQAAQGDESVVVANVAGVVSFRHPVTDGMSVSKGAPILNISAENMPDGDPVKRTRIAYETAKKEYERAAKLVKSQIISQKDFNAIKESYENALLAYEAISKNQTKTGVSVTAPLGGYIKNCLVKEGDYVSVGQPLVSITQNRRLFLRADVSEKYYGYLHSIQSANFKTPYDNKVYELGELKGHLLSYGKASGGTSFYVPVTFEFDNRGDVIPGSYVEVYLLSSEMPDVLALPVTALTEEQGLYFIYLQLDEEGYKKQEVTLGASDGKEVQILTGLKAGDRVVTKGAYQVKLASASNAIPAHSHEH